MNKYDFSYRYQKIIGLSHMTSMSIYQHNYIQILFTYIFLKGLYDFKNKLTCYKIENTLY